MFDVIISAYLLYIIHVANTLWKCQEPKSLKEYKPVVTKSIACLSKVFCLDEIPDKYFYLLADETEISLTEIPYIPGILSKMFCLDEIPVEIFISILSTDGIEIFWQTSLAWNEPKYNEDEVTGYSGKV